MNAATAETSGAHRTATQRMSEEIRVLMVRRGIKPRALEELLGKSQQAVNDRLRGRSRWTVDELEVLAGFFGVDANALLPGVGEQGDGDQVVRPLGLEPRTR